jgi:enoyl-CoA hydratase/carnithine racemase
MPESVRIDRQTDGVAVLRIDRPPLNALSNALLDEIASSARELAGDPDVKAVVVLGGAKAFAAGADISEFGGPDEARAIGQRFRAAYDAISEIPRPVIAAINGVALGGGLELALACDLRLAADGIEMGLLEVRLGIIPGAGGTQRLARVAGTAIAKELIFTGRRIPAALAAELGIVTRVVAPSELAAAADKLAAEVAECAPLAVAAAKRAIDGGAALALDAALALERASYETILNSEDRSEGLAAFAEKRRPQFKGK